MFATRTFLRNIPRRLPSRTHSSLSRPLSATTTPSSLFFRSIPALTMQSNRPLVAAMQVIRTHSFHSLIPTPLLTDDQRQRQHKHKHTQFNPHAALPGSMGLQMQTMTFSTADDRQRQRQERRAKRQGRVLEKDRPEQERQEAVTGEPVSEQQLSSGRRQIDAMSEGQNAYIRNVWGLVGANLGVCSVGTIAAMTVLQVSPIIPGIASLGLLLGLTMGAPKGSNPMLRAGLLGGFAFTTGMTLGPLVGMAMGVRHFFPLLNVSPQSYPLTVLLLHAQSDPLAI